MSAALCPQCNAPLPNPNQGESMVQCGGCGKSVFHAAASGNGDNDDADWLTLDDGPVTETVRQSPKKPADSNEGDPLDFFDDSAVPGPGPAGVDDDDDDWGELSLAPVKQRPGQGGQSSRDEMTSASAATSDSIFDDLDLPDTPPPPKPNAASNRSSKAQSPTGRSSNDPSSVGSETLAMPAAAASKDLLSSTDQTEYRVKCKVCDSVMFVNPKMQGKVIECSDCNTKIRVPPPPQPKAKKPGGASATAASESVGDGMMLRGGNTPVRPADPFTKSASQLLDEASREEVEEPDDNYDIPDVAEWAKGVFSIFKDLSVIAHWLILGTFGSLAAGLVAMLAHPGFGILMFPGGGIFALFVLACGFAILESTANDAEEIQNWPSLDMSLLIDNVIVTGAAILVAAVPAFAASFMIFGPALVTVAVTMLSIYAFFPFVLLSILDSGSVFQPFSSEVARSVNKCHEAWGGLYFTAGVLFGGLFFLFLASGAFGAVLGASISVFAAVAVVFIYFAMIGRLAFAIGQNVRSENLELKREQTED